MHFKEVVRTLVELGANVDLPDKVFSFLLLNVFYFLIVLLKNGATPLFLAVQKCFLELVKTLVELGANVNLPTRVF